MTRPPISGVGVVVPAHNEAELLGACLDSLVVARAATDVPVEIVVVLDACIDASAAVCLGRAVRIACIDARNVGRARADGAALHLAAGADPRRLWLASTDADSVVPPDWISRQVAWANAGADAVLGVVEVHEWDRLPPAVRSRFDDRYNVDRLAPIRTHSHVHGANLGVRASAYLRAGGFAALPAHEDRSLVESLDRLEGVKVLRSTDLRVRTSARLDSRCADGFGHDLRSLCRAAGGASAASSGA